MAGGVVNQPALIDLPRPQRRTLQVGGVDVTVPDGGTGVSSLTDGGILLGSGTNPITAMGALADGSIVVGDGTTDPVALAAFSSATGTLNVAQGGSGAATHTDGGILIGKGTAAFENLGEMADSTFVVGDGTTNPVVENAATARTSMGIANHDSIVVSAAGEATNSEQPAFLAIPASSQDNIAIDTVVTIIWGTELTDQNGDFASNTFTAPVTGNYPLDTSVRLDACDIAADFYSLLITTSNRNYQMIIDPGGWAADQLYTFVLSAVADMDAADTAIVTMNQIAGTQQSDVNVASHFSGYLAA